jgi:hypothetical protein
MTVIIDGTTGISPVTASGTSASVDGMTVGRGGGEVANNTAVGAGAMAATSTGDYNTAVGASSLAANTSGTQNTGIGRATLFTNTSGGYNFAGGLNSMYYNTSGASNTAVGTESMQANTTGGLNVAVGRQALSSNTTASYNTAVGYQAATANSTGTQNTAMGYATLKACTTAQNNAAFGDQALQASTTASYNTAIGSLAGFNTTTGANNTVVGYSSLNANTTGLNNTVIGSQAGDAGTFNYSTIIGSRAGGNQTSGDQNTYVGEEAGGAITTGSRNTLIGRYGGNSSGLDIRTSSNNIVLSDGDGTPRQYIDGSGNVFFNYGSATTVSPAPSGISMASAVNIPLQIYMLKQTQVEAHIGFKSSTDTNFYVGTSGGGGSGGIGVYGLYQQNVTNSWTAVSDERLKTELQPIENALEKVANVRTVTGRYTYDEENGVTRRLPFLIAQDFVTALPEAVDRQDPNKLGLSYSDTVVLAFAAIKELKTIVDAQAAEIAELKAK